MVTRHSSYQLGIGLALVSAVIYGAVPNFARMAYLNGVPALETVFYRTCAVAVALAIIGVLTSQRFVITRAAFPAFLFQTLATLLVSSCYLASIQFLPVTLSVIIFYTFPILVLLAAPMIEGRIPGAKRIAISLLGFLGLVVAVGPQLSGLNFIGIVLAFLGAIGCAMQFFSGRLIGRHMAPAAFGSLVHIILMPIILTLALSFGGGKMVYIDHQTLGAAAGFAIFAVCIGYVGGYFLHMQSVQFAPSSVVAPYFNVEPIVSTALAVFILHEAMTINTWIGGGMVFAALILASFLKDNLTT
jgi:drug/metabolite transporter (DMT)-like permease